MLKKNVKIKKINFIKKQKIYIAKLFCPLPMRVCKAPFRIGQQWRGFADGMGPYSPKFRADIGKVPIMKYVSISDFKAVGKVKNGGS
jgi:hypothetical protein